MLTLFGMTGLLLSTFATGYVWGLGIKWQRSDD